VGKYGTARQATNDNIIRRMRIACWMTKAADTYWEYVILAVFTRDHHQGIKSKSRTAQNKLATFADGRKL
jgi:hypothetical protein